jgi:hypothetical protein
MSLTPPPLPPALPRGSPPPLPIPAVITRAAPTKSRAHKRVVILTWSIVAVLVGLVGYRLVSVAYNVIHRPETRPHTFVATPYETLIGEGLSGSGFHFKVDDRVYIGATLHQFEGDMPKVMASLEFDDLIAIEGLAHKQRDVQILKFRSEKLNAIQPLSYSRSAVVERGTPVYVYSGEGPLKGHVTSVYKSTGKIMIRMTEAFAAAGQSGCPVISADTGSVVAVLVGANSPDQATRVEAELLVMP